MFPKDQCLKVVKKDGKRWIFVQMVNVISPISVPDNISAEVAKVDINQAAGHLKIAVNGKAIPVTVDAVRSSVELWTQGKKFTLDGIIKENKAAGLTIPVGGKIAILIAEDMKGLDFAGLMKGPGEYEVNVEWTGDGPINISVKADLKEIDVAFDEKST